MENISTLEKKDKRYERCFLWELHLTLQYTGFTNSIVQFHPQPMQNTI